MTGNEKIRKLIDLGSSSHEIQRAQDRVRKHLGSLHSGCATFLSYLLQDAGVDVPVTENAGSLALVLAQRGWKRIPVGSQEAGDVAVTADSNGNGMPDHILLLVEPLGRDLMKVCDNQCPTAHLRFASGRGRSPVAFFLRGGGA